MTITPQTTLRDLAFIICTVLDQAGTEAILSGGGAATVYAPEAYQSHDLDFILSYRSVMKSHSAVPLLELGFTESSGIYRHSASPFTVEFPPGPLSVGDEVIASFTTLHQNDLLLHILSPTDCVRDRLSWFLYYNDYSCLEQALAVSRLQEVDLKRVEQWCTKQNEARKFELFKARLERS